MNSKFSITSLYILLISCASLGMSNKIVHAQSAFEQQYPDVPRDALERRTRSMAKLKSEGVPLNESLPVIESEKDVEPRTTREIVLRAVCLLTVALKAEGLEKEQIDKITKRFQIASAYSPKERIFIDTIAPEDKDVLEYSWRYEAAYVMFWALGYVETPSAPRSAHDPAALVELIKTHSLEQLIADAKMKSVGEILDQADLIYRYRWALVDADLNGAAAPGGLNGDVAMEEHQALNWLIRYMDDEWDDMALDT